MDLKTGLIIGGAVLAVAVTGVIVYVVKKKPATPAPAAQPAQA